MNLVLTRNQTTTGTTIGTLTKDGVFLCYTLEDTIRKTGEKVYAETAIPAGTYPVTITMSARFKKLLPLLGNVAGFAGVRIHSGNTKKDTEGCILVGTAIAADKQSILNSRVAFNSVFKLINDALASGEKVTLTITNPEIHK
jgi:hypothetical protein